MVISCVLSLFLPDEIWPDSSGRRYRETRKRNMHASSVWYGVVLSVKNRNLLWSYNYVLRSVRDEICDAKQFFVISLLFLLS